jgi:hypothetical protein
MKHNVVAPLGQSQFSFIREGTCRFTPAQANLVFRECRYERNRDERRGQRHIDALARQMQAGEWLPRSSIDFACLPNGRLVLVNGHHRMLAQVKAGCDIEWMVIFHDCEDEAAVASLFWRFDTVIRVRSTRNVLDGVNAADNMGLSRLGVASLASAATFIDNGMFPPVGFRSRTYTPAEKLALMEEWQAEARAYEAATKPAQRNVRRKLFGAQVFSVALITMRAAPDSAAEFWRGVAADDGLKRGDPRKTFLDFLRDTHAAGSGYTGTAVAAARAWAAWEAGRDLSMIRIGRASVRITGSDVVVAP